MNIQNRVFLYAVVIAFIIISFPNAEVCKLIYTGLPEDINDSTLTIPSEAVMMSENILVGIPGIISDDSIITYETPSIFFVIDHSGSMFKTSKPKDRWGNRFDVTSQLIDTINKIYPEAEIGISVFGSNLYFDQADDSGIINEVIGYNSDHYDGGYLKLLKLDSTYESDTLGIKSGYEILKYYLETDTLEYKSGFTTKKYLGLRYLPSNGDLTETSTNITAGFDAVKEAYKKSSSKKENQYVIFISDGEASAPSKDSTVMNAFKEGDSVPTTFTIYFTDKDEIPGQIDTMTQHIKDNKYSENNIYSNAWSFDNTDSDTLMEFILSNIFSVINTKTVSKPIDIVVNGEKPDTAIANDSTTIYKFSKTFPFLGAKNDFHYEIIYSLYTDSITGDNDTIKSEKLDTTISDFTLELSEGAELPENFDLLCWDRFIEFYYNDQKIEVANETMDSIEIRFIPKELTMFYEYSGVSLNIETTDPNSLDKEKMGMNKPAEYFSLNAALSLATTSTGDGIVQLNETDTIVTIFRNEELPLDTLRAYLPFRLSSMISIDKAECFDNDANGFADSIFITISGKDMMENKSDLDQIIGHLTLPSRRNYEITKSQIFSNGIALIVKDNISTLNTSTHGESISIDKFIMNSGGMFINSTVEIEDLMAPVIVSAAAVQYESDDKSDTLVINYSESVKDIDFSNPSLFLDSKNLSHYSIDVSLMNFEDDNKRAVFEIENINDSEVINNHDSIWINWKGDYVGDRNSDINYQKNEKNIKRSINAVYIEMPYVLDSVVYFDNNADGHPDSIFMAVGNKNTSSLEDIKNEVVNKINFPSFRVFNITNVDVYDNGIGIKVNEGNNTLNTSTIKDTIVIDEVTLTNGQQFSHKKIVAIDRMAPVIVSALAIQYQSDSIPDSLQVTYSEQVNKVNYKEPSLFYSLTNDFEYSVELNYLNNYNDDKSVLFNIKQIKDVEAISNGDSIWINWEGDYVSDKLSDPNFQLNSENIHQPINAIIHKEPIDITISVVSPIDFKDLNDKNIIPDFIINILDEENKDELVQDNGDFKGMIIKTDLKTEIDNVVKLKGEFTLYDYLGNPLVKNASMSFSEGDNSLYYVWNGKNKNGRLVGSGTYLGLFKIYTDAENGLDKRREFNFKQFILVKE